MQHFSEFNWKRKTVSSYKDVCELYQAVEQNKKMQLASIVHGMWSMQVSACGLSFLLDYSADWWGELGSAVPSVLDYLIGMGASEQRWCGCSDSSITSPRPSQFAPDGMERRKNLLAGAELLFSWVCLCVWGGCGEEGWLEGNAVWFGGAGWPDGLAGALSLACGSSLDSLISPMYAGFSFFFSVPLQKQQGRESGEKRD